MSKTETQEQKQVITQDSNLKTILIIEKGEWGNRNRWTASSIEDKESLIETLENVLEDITNDLKMQKEK